MMNKKPLLILIVFVMIMTALTACTKNDPTDLPTDPVTEAPTTVPEETPPVKETLSAEEVKKLKTAHPDAFGLDTTDGLKVLAFGDSKGYFEFRIISGSLDSYPASISVPATKYRSLTVEEAKKVLAFYDLPDEKITLHPWQSMISSHLMTIDDELLSALKNAFDGRYEVGPEIKEELDPEEKRFDRYVYPITVDSEDWFDLPVTEKVARLRIDEAVLKNMNDRELVWAIADYPYLGNFGIYGNDFDLMEKECDALRELRSRDTFTAAINVYAGQVIEELKKEPVTGRTWMIMTHMKAMAEKATGTELPWEIPDPEEEPASDPTTD